MLFKKLEILLTLRNAVISSFVASIIGFVITKNTNSRIAEEGFFSLYSGPTYYRYGQPFAYKICYLSDTNYCVIEKEALILNLIFYFFVTLIVLLIFKLFSSFIVKIVENKN